MESWERRRENIHDSSDHAMLHPAAIAPNQPIAKLYPAVIAPNQPMCHEYLGAWSVLAGS